MSCANAVIEDEYVGRDERGRSWEWERVGGGGKERVGGGGKERSGQ
jgi:hypothetical protein